MKEWSSFDTISKGKGIWLIDSKGNKIIDAVGSMWCNVWGHSNPQLVKAITNQSKKIQHSSLFNFTNEPVEKLAENLIKISPGMNKVFYSDNGSSAMEIAIKMALQYWKNIGESKKTQIATIENGYHGDTMGTMSVSDPINGMHKMFEKSLLKQFYVSCPESSKDYKRNDSKSLKEMDAKLRSKNSEIAAVIIEPVLQGAGGMRIYHPDYLLQLKKLCKKHNVLLILDEIATGFGRTGKLFGFEHAKITPDILCLGKSLTGGYMSLAATVVSKKIAKL